MANNLTVGVTTIFPPFVKAVFAKSRRQVVERAVRMNEM